MAIRVESGTPEYYAVYISFLLAKVGLLKGYSLKEDGTHQLSDADGGNSVKFAYAMEAWVEENKREVD